MIEQLYRKLIIPGFETGLKRRKTFRFWDQLEQSQWWDNSRLQQAQVSRLRDLLGYCREKSPWYRQQWEELGINVNDIRKLDQLTDLPIMTREIMRDHASKIRSNDASLQHVSKSTGGSSGSPLQFTISEDADDRRVAATFRGYGWAGAPPGAKQSYLWGVRLGQTTRRQQWKDYLYSRRLYRRDMMNSFELTESNATKFVRRINKFRPRVLVGYTNPLFVLARAIQEQGLDVHHPSSIIVGAEKLHEFQRIQIERSFGSPVFETYGSREFTLIGAECDRHCGLHLSSENLIVEIVDDQGQPTPSGEEGQIVVTDLFNLATPFIRYAIGDRAVAGFSQCECGRGLPLLRKVVGRQLDILKLPDGRQVPGEFFPHFFKDLPAIRQFQVVQLQRDEILISVVTESRWSEQDSDRVCDQIRAAIGESSRLRVEEVEQIELTASGKMRVVIGHVAAHNRKAG